MSGGSYPSAGQRWRLGPSHLDYDAEPEIRNGFTMARRFVLTPKGVAATMPNAAASEGRSDAAPVAYPDRGGSGHLHCPAVLGCREGKIPAGWVRASEVVS